MKCIENVSGWLHDVFVRKETLTLRLFVILVSSDILDNTSTYIRIGSAKRNVNILLYDYIKTGLSRPEAIIQTQGRDKRVLCGIF